MFLAFVRTPRTLAGLVLAAVMALAAAPATAKAESFAMITIDNPTGLVVPYQYKWGEDGQWAEGAAAPYRAFNMWYPLDEDGGAPVPYIRFDDGCGDVATYHLDFYASRTRGYRQGKLYFFQIDGDGCLDLNAK